MKVSDLSYHFCISKSLQSFLDDCAAKIKYLEFYECPSFTNNHIDAYKVCLALDGTIFSSDQAYVALSRCSTWNNIEISHLDSSAFMKFDGILKNSLSVMVLLMMQEIEILLMMFNLAL